MRFCLVGHSASGLLGEQTGGSELQIALLAKALAERGHSVTLVVPGLLLETSEVDGVVLKSGWDPRRGRRGFRLITYRLPELRRVLVAEQADAYYTRGGNLFTSVVVSTARAVGAVSLHGLASDRELHPDGGRFILHVGNERFRRASGPAAHVIYRRQVLRAVDWVVTQNDAQAETCARLRLRSVTIPNIVEPPPAELSSVTEEFDVVWAGSVTDRRRSKGLEELIELASSLPDVTFQVVGRLSGVAAAAAIQRLGALGNVSMTGPLSHGEVLTVLARSRVVLNSSPSEGFSNTMLEGWSLGKPAVSLRVDPNRLLSSGRLGRCGGGSLARTRDALRELLANDGMRRVLGDRCRDYVGSVHSADAVCHQYEAVLAQSKTAKMTTTRRLVSDRRRRT